MQNILGEVNIKYLNENYLNLLKDGLLPYDLGTYIHSSKKRNLADKIIKEKTSPGSQFYKYRTGQLRLPQENSVQMRKRLLENFVNKHPEHKNLLLKNSSYLHNREKY